MRQRRWLELVKDYDCTINYHPGKANVVADALSRKSVQKTELNELQKMGVEIVHPGEIEIALAALTLQPTLPEGIKQRHPENETYIRAKILIDEGRPYGFEITADGVLRFRGRLFVPKDGDIQKEILAEAHSTPYSVHPGSTKMYRDLRLHYWWPGMKRDIAHFVERCLTCQQVKAEHQRPAGTLQPLFIPEWKWEAIAMDFMVG